MSDLIERLMAAIDEDERLATAASAMSAPDWATDGSDLYATRGLDLPHRCDRHGQGIPNACDDTELALFEDLGGLDPVVNLNHIVRHDPARTLAMVAAHRVVVASHQYQDDAGRAYCYSCEINPASTYTRYDGEWCPTLLALAKGYGIEVSE